MEKSLYQLPAGLGAIDESQGEPIEVLIGGLEIQEEDLDEAPGEFDENLAGHFFP
mgnify:CR=1 FL=1